MHLWIRTAAFFFMLASGSAPPSVSAGSPRKSATTRIFFSALNDEEKPVPGLRASDFELRVGGRIAALESFRGGLPYTDRSIPLAAWILIDFNPNIDSKVIQRQAGTAAAFFSMIHPDSALGVKLVSDRSETLAPLGRDPQVLAKAFEEFSGRRKELRAGGMEGAVEVGTAGLAGALGPALEEIEAYVAAHPKLRDCEVHRALMIISDGNLNPDVKLKQLYARAARAGTSIYPVFYPRGRYGPWVSDYFDLARKSAGTASVFGSLLPGSDVRRLPRADLGPNALAANFLHMIRNLNGRYSFTVPSPPAGRKTKLSLKCRIKGIEIRLPRTEMP